MCLVKSKHNSDYPISFFISKLLFIICQFEDNFQIFLSNLKPWIDIKLSELKDIHCMPI